jgi:type II secretory pathway pseudopilin PulG
VIAAIVLVLLLAVLAAIGFILWLAETQQHSEVESLRQRRQAERTVDNEFLRAKRDMNNASGQSWRNLVD